MNLVDNPAYLAAWIGLTALVGLVAGLYPAVFVSAIKPTGLLIENQPVHRRQDYLRKGLVMVQCTISVAMIVGTLVLYQQLGFLRNVKLGFEKEQIMVIPSGIRDIEESFPVLKQALLQHPGVLNVTDASSMPGVTGSRGFIRSLTAEVIEGAGTHRIDLGYIETGLDFVETMGIELIAGRSFHPGERVDSGMWKVILNEQAVSALGWAAPEDAIGQQVLLNSEYRMDVVGVMKDFHMKSLHQPIQPMALRHYPYGTTFFAAKLSPDDLENTLDNIRETWTSILPTFPLRYTFISDDFDRLYQADRHFGQVCGLFTSIAAFIAIQGLIGLASFSVGQRLKEISIRKALGRLVIPDPRLAVQGVRCADRHRQRRRVASGLLRTQLLATAICLSNRSRRRTVRDGGRPEPGGGDGRARLSRHQNGHVQPGGCIAEWVMGKVLNNRRNTGHCLQSQIPVR